jgi:hypothetical protein
MRTALLLKAISIADGKSNPQCGRVAICFEAPRNKTRCPASPQEIKFANTKNRRFSHCMPADTDLCLELIALLLDDPLSLIMMSPPDRHPI